MKQAILMSIQPEWLAKILNGEKTAEIRKTAPKKWLDYFNGKGPKPEPEDVYFYCTKNKLHYSVGALMFNRDDCFKRSVDGTYKYGDSVELMGYSPDYPYDKNNFLNGKIAAKFTLREIEEIFAIKGPTPFCSCTDYRTTKLDQFELYHKARMDVGEMDLYLHGRSGFDWHISDLVIFDEPKELNEFRHDKKFVCYNADFDYTTIEYRQMRLTKAPQSWCYMEVGE